MILERAQVYWNHLNIRRSYLRSLEMTIISCLLSNECQVQLLDQVILNDLEMLSHNFRFILEAELETGLQVPKIYSAQCLCVHIFHIFTLSLSVSLFWQFFNLKQYTLMSDFFIYIYIQSDNLCLLIEMFCPFIVNEITELFMFRIIICNFFSSCSICFVVFFLLFLTYFRQLYFF